MMLTRIHKAEAPKKTRTIPIYKNEVYKDIDLYTHKYVDGSDIGDLRIRNAVSSDSTEAVDGTLISRYVEFRDAQLRSRMRTALVEIEADGADNDLPVEEGAYVYALSLPEEFDDNLLKPLAEYIHRYLVFGTLYDWYAQFGMRQATVYGEMLDGLEAKINSIVRGPSIHKRPMQPFGPAKPL